MHQGALLTLESGVIPLEPSEIISPVDTNQGNPSRNPIPVQAAKQAAPLAAVGGQVPGTSEVLQASSPVERDEHYDRYLKEREAMLEPQSNESSQHQPAQLHAMDTQSSSEDAVVDKSRKEAVDDLLKSLGQSRGQ